MLNRFKTGDKIISLETNELIGLIENNVYEVLNIGENFSVPFVFIKDEKGITRFLSENRFDTPENKRKLLLAKMFGLYNVK